MAAHVDGTISGELVMDGILQSPRGYGRLEVSQARLYGENGGAIAQRGELLRESINFSGF
jgi:hypothetical protein